MNISVSNYRLNWQENIGDRPVVVTPYLFEDMVMITTDGKEVKINNEKAD